ncbi:MAG: hypothetical protein AAF660_05100 [Pseudomonadota bacterium]
MDEANAVPPRKLGRGKGFALGALRQEIRAALTERFKAAFSAAAYNAAAPSASDVAGDALSAAGQVAKADPLDARSALAQLRRDVATAGDAIRDIIDEDDLDDVEEAIAQISRGLDGADTDAARNTASSTSFLSAESVLKQRSSIRIRTQEGDLVTLDLRRRDSFSAEDVAIRGANGAFTTTEVSVSSRSRLQFSVRGDINEQELSAIQAVFEQAEAIADDFFGGDLARAFDAASSLNYDAGQLARVSLKFREREVTRVEVAEFGTVAPPPAIDSRPVRIPVELPSVVTPREPVETPAGAAPIADVTEKASAPADIGAQLVQASDAVTEDAPPTEVAPDPKGAVEAFVENLGDFLRSTLEGFSTPGSGDQRFFYSESFKLKILKSVISVSAPSGGERAAETAGAVVDAVSREERDDD